LEAEKKLRGFILENFLFSDDDSLLDNADSFLDKGIVDSTGMLEIIHYLDDEFGIKVGEDEMVPENLDSINNLKAYIAGKQS
jgi:acyl carrier protein